MKILGFGLIVAFVVGIVLGVWYGVWSLWCWAVPQIWPTGPHALIQPSYWLFVAILLLAGFVGKTIFGGTKKEAD